MRPELARGSLSPFEAAFRAATRTRPVPGARSFLLSVHPYRGRPVTLRDGTVVRRGALIGELHLWNQHVAAAYRGLSERQVLWGLMREVEADLGHLAAYAEEHLPPEVVAIFALTRLGPMSPRLGFTYVPLPPSLALRAITAWQRMLGRVFRPAGRPRARAALAGACWLSRGELGRRYGGSAGSA